MSPRKVALDQLAHALGLFLAAVLEDAALWLRERSPEAPAYSVKITPADAQEPAQERPAPIAGGVAPIDYSGVPCPVVGCAGMMNHWGDHLDAEGETIALMVEIPVTDFREGRRERDAGKPWDAWCGDDQGGAQADAPCDLDAGHPGDHDNGATGAHWSNRSPLAVRRRLHEVIDRSRLGLPLDDASFTRGEPDAAPVTVAGLEAAAEVVSRLPLPSEVGHGRPVIVEGPEDDHGRPTLTEVSEVFRADNLGRDCPVCGRRRHTGDQAAECAEAMR